MANFNTYQTRHFYVANAIDESVDTNLDIYLGSVKTGDFFFKYKNADGLVTRSDTVNPCWIRSVTKAAAEDMARPLMAHTIAVDTSAVTLTNLVGKTVNLTITFQEFIDYSPASNVSVVVSLVGNSTNTANATAFHKALAEAIALALPEKNFPLLKVFSNGSEVTKAIAKAGSATGSASGVVLVEACQKYVRGKLSGEPIPFTVAFNLHGSNVDDVVWGTDTVAKSAISGNTVMPANYILADLEYFALGERGDIYRGSMWPNNYEPTYAIALSGDYDVLTIEYYWQGTAENVQKSPRMIQIAAPANTSVVATLYDQVQALMAGVSES